MPVKLIPSAIRVLQQTLSFCTVAGPERDHTRFDEQANISTAPLPRTTRLCWSCWNAGSAPTPSPWRVGVGCRIDRRGCRICGDTVSVINGGNATIYVTGVEWNGRSPSTQGHWGLRLVYQAGKHLGVHQGGRL
jgi:hypothetical protein